MKVLPGAVIRARRSPEFSSLGLCKVNAMLKSLPFSSGDYSTSLQGDLFVPVGVSLPADMHQYHPKFAVAAGSISP